ncbi:nuclear transport factor 2 family protein [Vibrio quintilis]|uniref:SnoaL-like domain-containing protein n=1 Tax=Vibrio quintilis TaxID=1117707 RepID=A0A1M7YWH2_9VIBR|nr:nuclear transport factor 2 family protein [Vibrio quintilis]SHO57029.1 hypothetical protein VQ7734_02798 [Vibrio quintilis]
MDDNAKLTLVESYVHHYNTFNIPGMLSLLDDGVVFENESNGVINTHTEGREEFEQLAHESAKFFSAREQKITYVDLSDSGATIGIDYKGVLAVDLPNGMKAGEVLAVEGKSFFEFSGDKICYIRDMS